MQDIHFVHVPQAFTDLSYEQYCIQFSEIVVLINNTVKQLSSLHTERKKRQSRWAETRTKQLALDFWKKFSPKVWWVIHLSVYGLINTWWEHIRVKHRSTYTLTTPWWGWCHDVTQRQRTAGWGWHGSAGSSPESHSLPPPVTHRAEAFWITLQYIH